MRREGVGLLFREDIQVVMIRLGNLGEKKGIWGGNGGGRKGGRGEGGSSENGRRRGGGRRRGEGRGGWWGCEAGRRAEGGGEGEGTPGPVYAGVVAGQPRKPEDHLEVTQPCHLESKILCMIAMYFDPGREIVGDGSSRGRTAVDEL